MKEVKNSLSDRILSFMVFPKSKFVKLVLPISYLIFLQVLTGIPKPHTLKNFNAGILIEEFSSEIFSYPFWIQDLSHLPLFFVLAWLSQLFFQKKSSPMLTCSRKALIFSLSYALANELSQTFIPDRFPSIGDVIMNILGVIFGHFFYQKTAKKILHLDHKDLITRDI